jgi:hypothetical protein
MRVPNDHPLARTLALRDPERAASAAAHLADTTEPAVLEALCELVLNPDAPAKAVSAALFSLRHDVSPLTSDTVVRALHSAFPSVRIQACGEVERRELFAAARESLVRLLTADPFWQVRRAAIFALARGEMWDALAPAAHDPHGAPGMRSRKRSCAPNRTSANPSWRTKRARERFACATSCASGARAKHLQSARTPTRIRGARSGIGTPPFSRATLNC